jgi:hypothetical protein
VSDEASPQSFLAEPTTELRQGDICFEWPFPKWQFNGYLVASAPTGGSPTTALVGLYEQGRPLPIVICSHDCDLENPRSRSGFVVAPVFPWPFDEMGSDNSLALINSRIPGQDGAYSHINLYPIKLPDDQPDWRVIDFSAMTSVGSPNKAIPVLRKAKRFEMTDEVREAFSNKLAAFFIR